MFSVRCQTPSADAEEIHPKWWGDGGRGGRGRREKQRGERSQPRWFSRATFLSVPVSETVEARPWWDTSECGAEAALWQRRWWPPGWQGHRMTAYNRDCSLCNRASMPTWMDQDTTLLSKHTTLLWRNCARLESAETDCQSQLLCAHPPDPGLPHLKPLSCLAEWRGLRGRGWGQSPASPFLGPLLLLAPSPGSQLCLPQEAPASGQQTKLNFSAMFPEFNYIYNALPSLTSSGYARGKIFLDVTSNGWNEAISQIQKQLTPDESLQGGLHWKWPNITVCRSSYLLRKKLWRRSSYSTLCCSKDFP